MASNKFSKKETASKKFSKQETASKKFSKQETASNKFSKQEIASNKFSKQETASNKFSKQETASKKFSKQEIASNKFCKQEIHSKKFSEKEIAEYKKIFTKYDRDRGGQITVNELGCVMQSLGHDLSRCELQTIIDSVDRDGSKTMDFDEFMDWMETKVNNAKLSKEILEDFRRHDLNKDGYITPDELREVIRVKGERMCNAEVDVMMSQVDINKDGKVNYEEFAKMMVA